jgi:(2Fe-2S) ferredoxin
MEPFQLHLYVCTQTKPEGNVSCPSNGSAGILQVLERELLTQGLDDQVQVTTCGCLGLCDDGPILVVYPEGIWYRKVTESGIAQIVASHLKGGKVVSRLEWRDAPAMRAKSIEHRDRYRAAVKARNEAAVPA